MLYVAEGESHNSVHLAGLDNEIHSMDQSSEGLNKAVQFARKHGVKIKTHVADLATFLIEPGAWQAIVSIFPHIPAAMRRELHRKVVLELAPNGVFLLQAYTVRQLETGGIVDPSRKQMELFMSLAKLQSELPGLPFELARELQREVNEENFIVAAARWFGTGRRLFSTP